MNNGGWLTTNQQGHLKNHVNVWYHPKYISNILSLSDVKKSNRIIYDSDNGDRFIIIKTVSGWKYMIFTVNSDRLYYKNMGNTESVYIISTVKKNQKHYNQWKYECANILWKLYRTVDHPSIKHYKNIIKKNAIKHCLVTIEYIDIFESVFGPDIYILKLKTVLT